jgi:hypothetical protein
MRKCSSSVATIFDALPCGFACALLAAAISISTHPVNAAEFGSSPYPKGFRDIFAGIIPPVPGLYVLEDLYHYDGNVGATVLDGAVQLGVEAKFTADFLPITYVTKWKILGGTYAFGVAPVVMSMDTNAGLSLPSFTGPLGRTFGPFETTFGDTETALGDTGFTPITLGWSRGNFYWNVGVTGFAPTGEYSTHSLANTSLNRWAVIPTAAITYFDPNSHWQASAAFAYAVNFENPATDYTTGNLFHIDSSITKNFGALGVGGVAYAMIQTTPDSGAGAKLGDFEAQVYGVGPILTYTLGAGTPTPLTLIAKWYHEFGAENTFEGDTVVGSASFKF